MDETIFRNGTVLGFVGGLVLGLLIAVVVALYITNAPVPFVAKVQRATENVHPGADGKLPDPNKPLNPPLPPRASNASDSPVSKSNGLAVPGPETNPPAETAGSNTSGAAPATGSSATLAAQPPEVTRYMVQAGAYRSAEDADAVRAKLAMLGLDARVFPIEQQGATLFRVRLGPYGQLNDIDRIRRTLAENKIDAQVVPIR